ncbi:hypothetical protein HGRIS_007297 [Hohenbuehelia grisea]|uniref:Core domain-containing protein n=1 Tax=Hohenbuehelia grisea TaxID=104357 RepID=A0ABR3J5S4_9AGAR
MASTVARISRPSTRIFAGYTPIHVPSCRRALMSALRTGSDPNSPPATLENAPPVVVPTAKSLSSEPASPQTAAPPPPAPKTERPRPKLRATKATLTITPTAVERLRALLKSPTPQLIRIGVKNKGCAGLSYHLEYVDKPGKFDEIVEHDGVRVLIDSKALFSIIGSEMDWQEDALSSKFAFRNPNIVDACGCGESFSIGS